MRVTWSTGLSLKVWIARSDTVHFNMFDRKAICFLVHQFMSVILYILRYVILESSYLFQFLLSFTCMTLMLSSKHFIKSNDFNNEITVILVSLPILSSREMEKRPIDVQIWLHNPWFSRLPWNCWCCLPCSSSHHTLTASCSSLENISLPYHKLLTVE